MWYPEKGKLIHHLPIQMRKTEWQNQERRLRGKGRSKGELDPTDAELRTKRTSSGRHDSRAQRAHMRFPNRKKCRHSRRCRQEMKRARTVAAALQRAVVFPSPPPTTQLSSKNIVVKRTSPSHDLRSEYQTEGRPSSATPTPVSGSKNLQHNASIQPTNQRQRENYLYPSSQHPS